jgi:hypothetical protein
MVEVDRQSLKEKQTRIDQEELYNQKLHQIQELIPKVTEVEKLEFLVSELSAVVRSLKADLLDLSEQRQILADGRTAAEAKAAISPTALYETKLAQFEQRCASAVKRRQELAPKSDAITSGTEAYEIKSREIDQLYSEVAKKAAQTRSVEDLAARMAEDLYGQKQVIDLQEASLAKVLMLKRNIALISLDEQPEEEEEFV